ncbi:hypothetical protein Cni_G18478 [Canna indica]|uniref:Mechanosensitive ion channel protein n=1 Tax=Canna indica TaxID=4628 RepID=A0AAQ3KKT8_9LILI|nr:hypothetical protein Cni_G18478 [Canna indica]
MESLRRSFKSHNSSHKYPSSRPLSHELEERPILLDNDDAEHHGEVVVKIDGNSHDGGTINQAASSEDVAVGGNNSKVWRESSYEFWRGEDGDGRRRSGTAVGLNDDMRAFSFKSQQSKNPEAETSEDPPSRLISTFLRKQRAAGSELALDMDMEMEELRKNFSPTSASGSKDLRVSFQAPFVEPHPDQSSSPSSSDVDDRGIELRRRKASTSPSPVPDGGGGGEVLLCTSSSSIRPNSNLLLNKTRSRLMDPMLPPQPPTVGSNAASVAAGIDEIKKSGRVPKSGQLRSGQIRSGMIGKSQRLDEDDADSFTDEDIPDDYKSTEFSYLTILEWVSLVLIIAALACSLALRPLKRMELLDLHLWKWLLLLFVLICGRLVSGWIARFIVFCIERNFFLIRKRVLYFVYGLRDAVRNCLWLSLVLLSWELLFDNKVRRHIKSNTLPYVTKILFCLLVATILRLLKTLFVKVLASSFHVSTYFDRIQESLFNQYVIETLSGPPLIEIRHIREEEEQMMAEVEKLQNAGAKITSELEEATLPSKSGRVIGSGPIRKSGQIGKIMKLTGGKQQEEGITIEELHKLNQKNISAWRMKRLMRIVRHGTLSTLDEQVLQATGDDDSLTQIRSEVEAKVAARKIFANVARPGVKYIYLQDLMRFMRDDEAAKTMTMFVGGQENNRVNRRSLKNWVVNAFRERRALALTLNDTKTAVTKLHQMANIVVGIIVIALWLIILEIASTHFFVLLSSQLLLFMENKKEHWYPNQMVVLRDVFDMNRLNVSIWMRHRINFQDMGERYARRELVVQEMIRVCKELDIEYRMLPMDVNVRNMPVVSSTRIPSTWTTFNY